MQLRRILMQEAIMNTRTLSLITVIIAPVALLLPGNPALARGPAPDQLSPASVQAALDAVPDPVNGLLVYRGRGGGAGSASPRRPRPSAGAGAISLPEPGDESVVQVTGMTPPGLPEPVRAGAF